MNNYQPIDYARYRYQKAIETLGEVETHIQNAFWNTAINRMYYSCFYAVGALLALQGIETSSHSGVRQQFGQLFVKTGKIDTKLAKHYTNLFEKRHKGDYNDFFDYDEKAVLELLPLSKQFIEVVGGLIAQ